MHDDPRDQGPDDEIAPPLVPTPKPSVPGPSVPEPAPTTREARNNGRNTKAAVAGALAVGGLAGAVILGPLTASAASPSSSGAASTPAVGATAAPAATSDPSATEEPSTGAESDTENGTEANEPHGGHVEAVTDTSVAAKAIGISEADLLAALATGKTVADVAAAHNVPVQTVVDALVTDGLNELDAQVKAGTLTQAQADAMKPEVTQRATDQVNSTFQHH